MNDAAIEIYPKLDATLLDTHDDQLLPSSTSVDSVMRNLIWMLEVANHYNFAETATAHLEEASISFFDLFAYLLARNLLPELERGVAHAYVTFGGDRRSVRGRIGLVEQMTRNWNRFDRVFCSWDEFTLDTAINRLFKCACRFLSERVKYFEAARLLMDCQALLDEVEEVSPAAALNGVWNLRLDRSMERFRTTFDLARRLLAGIGHNLGVGGANTFVFLLDMNELFENYVLAVLEWNFPKAVVEAQKDIGCLFSIPKGGIIQLADYYWRDGNTLWVGDAKYKHLAKGRQSALRFRELDEIQYATDESASLAGRVLSPGDVRQLTVYAELVRRREELETPPHIMLLYPFVGARDECLPDVCSAWNGSDFWLTPVFVKPLSSPADAITLLMRPIPDW